MDLWHDVSVCVRRLGTGDRALTVCRECCKMASVMYLQFKQRENHIRILWRRKRKRVETYQQFRWNLFQCHWNCWKSVKWITPTCRESEIEAHHWKSTLCDCIRPPTLTSTCCCWMFLNRIYHFFFRFSVVNPKPPSYGKRDHFFSRCSCGAKCSCYYYFSAATSFSRGCHIWKFIIMNLWMLFVIHFIHNERTNKFWKKIKRCKDESISSHSPPSPSPRLSHSIYFAISFERKKVAASERAKLICQIKISCQVP